MLYKLRLYLARKELDSAYEEMRNGKSINGILRYSNASKRYYRVKYRDPDFMRGM